MARKQKMMAVASEGGHFVQLMRLRPAFEGMETVYVSTNPGLASAFELNNFRVLPDANMDKKAKLLWVLIRAFFLVLKERPTHVVSTGAAPGFAVLACARLLGAKTIWIDSIANADELSAAGAKAKYVAHHWLTQWEHLTKEYPGLEYKGRVI
ncbi:MAG: UDP-N-acetylglucosamine--LPS N-acetylglucosamine transferase [Oleibacter sp.]|nr:UDP-N-acetylglucosamine--LPS N-acetylglucosamine transferase [Thalassolituus sp.]